MSKQKIQTARELIKEKRYAEARAILKTVDDALAREWLAKLDEIDPFGDVSPSSVKAEKPKSRKLSRVLPVIFIGICGTLFILSSLIAPTPEQRNATQTAQAVIKAATGQVLQATPDAEATIIALTPPTATATITDTPMPSITPPPTATLTLEQQARPIILSNIASADELAALVVNDRVVTIRYPLTQLSGGLARSQADREFVHIVCDLRAAGFTTQEFAITGTIEIVDSFGNTSTAEGVEMILSASTAAQMNCDEPDLVRLENIAERYDISPLLDE